MCKASVLAEEFRNGEVGDQLGIYTGQHGLGTFNEQGTVPGACATCLQTGASMIFEDIPPKLQQDLGIGDTEAATFIDLGVTVSVSFVPEDELAAEDVLDAPVEAVPVGVEAMAMLRQIAENRALADA